MTEYEKLVDKIEFSNITKEQIKNKLIELKYRGSVCYPTIPLEEEVFHIIKNYLHPRFKHRNTRPSSVAEYLKGVPREKREYHINLWQQKRDNWYYENSQFNYKYTFKDILTYIGVDSFEEL